MLRLAHLLLCYNLNVDEKYEDDQLLYLSSPGPRVCQSVHEDLTQG